MDQMIDEQESCSTEGVWASYIGVYYWEDIFKEPSSEFEILSDMALVDKHLAIRMQDIMLLDPDEEFRLFRLYNFLKWQHSIEQDPLILARMETDLERIRHSLIVSNIPMVKERVGKWILPGMDMEDSTSEANMVLFRCVEKFDYRKMTKFSTYLFHALRRCCNSLRERYREWRVRRVSCWVDTVDEMAMTRRLCGLTRQVEKIDRVSKHKFARTKVDKNGDDSPENLVLVTLAPSVLTVDPLEAMYTDNMVSIALKELTEIELFVITHRFDLDGAGKWTLDEVGKRMPARKISRERVSKIEEAALAKMNHLLVMRDKYERGQPEL